ncbi:hypothetical protein [Fluviicola chungangensis]|uniref:DUF4350 domain-containing protein n=1 Tax=Fluviicola chungangensis TaxID=2597671 RepID=A0A556N3A5_9FLAO|nr:hypothetical protein [Fluviicola chungangensis]TSJ46650.1 hypothetical protein FO442_05685 [Fluviicola chungangensis]
MNKKVILSFLGFALFIGLVIWLLDNSGGGEAHIQKKYSSDWKKTYELNDENPRNISFFMELLDVHVKDSVYNLKYWSDLDSIPRHEEATYLFIGNELGAPDDYYDSIMHYADSGATVYLSFNHLTSNLYDRHFEEGAFYWDYSKVLFAWIGDTTVPFYHVYENDTINEDWYAFSETEIIDTNYRSYLFAMKHPFAFYEKHHKGKVHFHSIPDLFENYQVIQPNGYAHARIVLNKIPKDKPVIFLTCGINDSSEPVSIYEDEDADSDGAEKEDTSLIQFILKNPILRLAFLLMIVLLLLYVFFRAKRKEEILPGYSQKRNMSLAFVETLSSIYISRNSPIGVLQVMRKNFYSAMNRHFYVDLSRKETREQNLEKLIAKVPYDSEKLVDIVNSLDSRKNNVDNRYLGTTYAKIRAFYIETGIVRPSESFVVSDKVVDLNKRLWPGALVLLKSILLLMKGLMLLAAGGSIGMFLVIPAMVLIYLASRFIRLPLATIQSDQLIIYGFVAGKRVISLNQTIHCTVDKTRVTFECEDGNTFIIRQALLSRRAQSALYQFVEFIKLHNS